MSKSLSWSDLDCVKVLGEGKSGVVWLAILKNAYGDLPAGTRVAIKTYKAWVLEESGQYERIIRELETGRSIAHMNVLRALTLLGTPDGSPAIVMQYYPGETLEAYMDRKREAGNPIALNRAFQIIEGLASGIAAVHRVGCIHRDIKPANIVFDGRNPVIMDFGVVRTADLQGQTTTGNFLGTLRYSAPEYIFGEKYDETVDTYSFGAIVYELLSGELFLSNVENWAEVIVQKSKMGLYEDTATLLAFYREVERMWGIGVAEFVRHLLQHSLCRASDRQLDFENVAEACRKKCWGGLFYTDGAKIVGGVNPEQFNRGDRTKLSVKEIAENARNEFSVEERKYLTEMLQENYWEGVFSPSDATDPTLRKIEERGKAVRFLNYDSGDHWYQFHPAALLAYQYELI